MNGVDDLLVSHVPHTFPFNIAYVDIKLRATTPLEGNSAVGLLATCFALLTVTHAKRQRCKYDHQVRPGRKFHYLFRFCQDQSSSLYRSYNRKKIDSPTISDTHQVLCTHA